MASTDKRTGLGALHVGLVRPTTPPEPEPEAEAEAEAGQGGSPVPAADEASAPEGKTPRRRAAKKSAAAPAEKLEGRRIYLSEGVHFRLRMAAYQRGKNISEVAEEVLDKNLPRYDVSRVG
jgi:hypothetical protein